MNEDVRLLIKMLQAGEVDYIPATDNRALNLKVKYNKTDVLCFGLIVPKEYMDKVCDYEFNPKLGLYLKVKG